MSVQHSPGPWQVYHAPLRPHLSMAKIIEVQDRDGAAVVAWPGFDSADQRPKQKLANAWLIAAAPKMLAALREAEAVLTIVPPRNSMKEYIACLHRVRAAIALTAGD